MYLNCLCANLAYGLPELNKTYLLTHEIDKLISGAARLSNAQLTKCAIYIRYSCFVELRLFELLCERKFPGTENPKQDVQFSATVSKMELTRMSDILSDL